MMAAYDGGGGDDDDQVGADNRLCRLERPRFRAYPCAMYREGERISIFGRTKSASSFPKFKILKRAWRGLRREEATLEGLSATVQQRSSPAAMFGASFQNKQTQNRSRVMNLMAALAHNHDLPSNTSHSRRT
jgi:hypothetical protein